VKVVVSRHAFADIGRLKHFLETKNPAAANRAGIAIADAIRSLEYFPNRGRPSGPPGVRELIVPFGHSAYVLRYAVSDELVVVLRIWHGREDHP
jgi:plasmid stabilization system protein ParE